MMCEACGCGNPERVAVDLHEKILAGNAVAARHNREHLAEHGVLALNLMGAPGSGKTALLESTARAVAGHRLRAITGDLATHRDAERLRQAGIPSFPITTGSACHLDAEIVHGALHEIPLAGVEFLFIENVGNLVCPAVYDLGQDANVVTLSVTEGEDKPLKYPAIFRAADLVLLTKIDLLPHLQVRVDLIEDALARVTPHPQLLPVSASTGNGIDRWVGWLAERRRKKAATGPLTAGRP